MDKYVARVARSAAGRLGKRSGPLAALVCAAALAACAPGGGTLGLSFAEGGISAYYRPRPDSYGQFSPGYHQPQPGFGASLQTDYGGVSPNGFYPAQPRYDGQTSPGYDQAQIGFGDRMQTGLGPQPSAGFYPAWPGYSGEPSSWLGGQPAQAGLGTSGGVGPQALAPPPAWAAPTPFGIARRTDRGPGW